MILAFFYVLGYQLLQTSHALSDISISSQANKQYHSSTNNSI